MKIKKHTMNDEITEEITEDVSPLVDKTTEIETNETTKIETIITKLKTELLKGKNSFFYMPKKMNWYNSRDFDDRTAKEKLLLGFSTLPLAIGGGLIAGSIIGGAAILLAAGIPLLVVGGGSLYIYVYSKKFTRKINHLHDVISILKILNKIEIIAKDYSKFLSLNLDLTKDSAVDMVVKILTSGVLSPNQKVVFLKQIDVLDTQKLWNIIVSLTTNKSFSEADKKNIKINFACLNQAYLTKFSDKDLISFLKDRNDGNEDLVLINLFSFFSIKLNDDQLNNYFSTENKTKIQQRFGTNNLSLGVIFNFYFLRNDLQSLKGLLSPEALNKIQKHLLSSKQSNKLVLENNSHILLNNSNNSINAFFDFSNIPFSDLSSLVKNSLPGMSLPSNNNHDTAENNNNDTAENNNNNALENNNNNALENNNNNALENKKIQDIITELGELHEAALSNKAKGKECDQKVLALFNLINKSETKLTTALTILNIPNLDITNLVQEALKKDGNIKELIKKYSFEQQESIINVIKNSRVSKRDLTINNPDFNAFRNITLTCKDKKDELFKILNRDGADVLLGLLWAAKDGCVLNLKNRIQFYIFEKEYLFKLKDEHQWGLYLLGKIFLQEAQNYINTATSDVMTTNNNIFDIASWKKLPVSLDHLFKEFKEQAIKEEDGYTKNTLYASLPQVQNWQQAYKNLTNIDIQKHFETYFREGLLDENSMPIEGGYEKEEKNLILLSLFETFSDLKNLYPEQYEESKKSLDKALEFINQKIQEKIQENPEIQEETQEETQETQETQKNQEETQEEKQPPRFVYVEGLDDIIVDNTSIPKEPRQQNSNLPKINKKNVNQVVVHYSKNSDQIHFEIPKNPTGFLGTIKSATNNLLGKFKP